MSRRCSCPGHDRLRWRAGTTRRDVLRFALGGMGIAALGPLVKRLPVAYGAPIPGQKTLVMINLDGGCDTLNMVIPSTLSQYPILRPTLAIPNGTSLDLTGTGGPSTTLYRLHPQLDKIQSLWNDGDVALVQRVGYPEENLSHFESQDIFSFGVRGSFLDLPTPAAQSGWIARYAELEAPTPMGAVSVGMGRPRAFIGGASSPLQVSSLTAFKFGTDSAFANNHLLRIQIVKDMLAASTATGTTKEVRDAVDQAYQLSDQVQTALGLHNTYLGAGGGVWNGLTTSIARRLRDVAALTYGGFETRIFYTGLPGFDTHGDQGAATGNGHPTLMQWLDDAVGAFATDMKNMGRWDDTILCVFTEFGRRNYENLSLGTDHGAAFAMLLVGGAVNGGAYGPVLSDADLLQEYLTYGVDFRDVYKEIVSDHLGGNAAPVFPEPQPTNTVLGIA